jgi:hypothetical protein
VEYRDELIHLFVVRTIVQQEPVLQFVVLLFQLML